MTQHHPAGDHDAARHHDSDLGRLPLSDLALFSAHALQTLAEGGTPNDRYPLELFRRAVVLHDSAAWRCIYRQYAPFVLPWLLKHPLAETLLEQKEPAALVDTILSAFATALTEPKLAQLNSLVLLLKFLRMCVHSTLADLNRDRQLFARLAGERAPDAPLPGHTADGQQADAQGLWQILVEELQGEDEQVLFTLLVVRGVSALEICTHEPQRFPDTQAVYQAQARIFTRLRASERLQAMLGPQL